MTDSKALIAQGPLQGLKVIEMAGLGPAPFCAMMLADMGAEVIRIDQKRRPGAPASPFFSHQRFDVLARGRRSIALDLKKPTGVQTALALVDQADALLEGFRPGVMERLGLSPEICQQRNPKLVYGRMTGWGQYGPLASAAGHDINYVALTGALSAMGRPGTPPAVPLNLVGDFGGGAMMMAFGLVCGLLEARRSGRGQVIDAAMTDGAALLSAAMYGFKADGQWSNERNSNMLDGGAPYYDTYTCADGKHVALGAIEPQFYALLREKLGLSAPEFDAQNDRTKWPELKRRIAAVLATKTRDQWCALLEGTDACFAPVLDWDEAPKHPHNQERRVFTTVDGVLQPAPAPRFSRTPGDIRCPPAAPGEHSVAVLRDWGLGETSIEALQREGVI
ncbi:MAG TPA: CaiB/BaiF CoA-transferase family protein [Solimonas sp.]|nr:CaiB/BaiF CoA-transferase family protein [Solimonas sp.]